MQELQSKILGLWHAERPRWILWLPVLLGMGVGLYFALPFEPSRGWLTLAALLCVAMAIAMRRFEGIALCVFCLAWIAAGAALGAWRSHIVQAPILQDSLYPQAVEGVVSGIDTKPDSIRLTLSQVHIEHVPAAQTPQLVTVSLRGQAAEKVELGDTIRLRAGFFPPPMPVIPGGYAFNRHFYFQRIGANGYAPGKTAPEILHKAAEAEGLSAAIARFRHKTALWLMERMGKREGAVAAALMVGEAKAIPEDIYEAMRQSGLVHILSISGTHLGLAAGIFFFSLRFLLAAIPPFAARYDGKKAAAILALCGAFAYLLVAGAPISAQRSFIMVALVLGAVLLSRNVTPMRSLCLAALLLLVFAPESLLNPGFQLSFAATMGILAYYEHWREKKAAIAPEEWTWKRKTWLFWSGIITTSAIATLATTPYVLHHFDSLPLYAVLGNLLVMPLVSFWIMPLVVAVLLLLPFSAADWLLPLLKAGIMAMDKLAAWVAALPQSTLVLPPLPTNALVLVTLGGLWLCLWQQKWRHLGWLAIAAGMAGLLFYQPPDIVISADSKKIALRTGEGSAAMLRGQRSGFVQDGWLRFLQVAEFGNRKSVPPEQLRCDTLGCVYHAQGKAVAFSFNRAGLVEDCQSADMTITPYWSSYRDVHGQCGQGLFFDRGWIAKSAGVAFWLDGARIRYRTVRQALGDRPWSNMGQR